MAPAPWPPRVRDSVPSLQGTGVRGHLPPAQQTCTSHQHRKATGQPLCSRLIYKAVCTSHQSFGRQTPDGLAPKHHPCQGRTLEGLTACKETMHPLMAGEREGHNLARETWSWWCIPEKKKNQGSSILCQAEPKLLKEAGKSPCLSFPFLKGG